MVMALLPGVTGLVRMGHEAAREDRSRRSPGRRPEHHLALGSASPSARMFTRGGRQCILTQPLLASRHA